MVLPHLSAVRTQGKANVAQLVEQLIRNQQVTGSNPVVGSLFKTLIDSVLRHILALVF